jgi:hypothetical protein
VLHEAGHSQGIVAYLMGMGIGIGTTFITGMQCSHAK